MLCDDLVFLRSLSADHILSFLFGLNSYPFRINVDMCN